MRQILAIGGGGFESELPDLTFDRYALSIARPDARKVCFVPTATGDAPTYIDKFTAAYKSLGCETSVMSLYWPSRLDLGAFMMEQDVIFVGGGNTRNLLVLWRDWGLDVAIRKAYENGTVLAGVSAGANCWFEEFSTDSMGPLTPWKGLGWLAGSFCPHYDSEPDRRPSLKRMLEAGEIGPGYGSEENTAVHFIDEQMHRCVATKAGAKVFYVDTDGERALDTEVI